MRTIWIIGDQLSLENSALAEADPATDCVLIIESRARGEFLRYHKKRLVLIYSGLRHFVETLRGAGWEVDHHPMEKTLDYQTGIQRHLQKFPSTTIYLAEPNDWPTTEVVRKLAKKYPIETVATRQFLLPRDDFSAWADGKDHLLMELHYRRMRQRTAYLMKDGQPEGGAWNLDHENRKTYREWVRDGKPLPPARITFVPDVTTLAIMALVEREFPDHPGSVENFNLPVTREQAVEALDDFIEHRLGKFGDFEDLMLQCHSSLFHSVLTPSLNLGLLGPAECVEAALTAYQKGKAPLNSVEGFIRQIIGWREFINGVYWHKMPDYKSVNVLQADHPLPEFFYTGKTPMNCLHQTITQVIDIGYNHHIQRLMVLGNFLLIAGVRPQEALRWFLEMYVDAWDWVMAANVLGMILYADGGYLATKPYAASSAYIKKMSNYCQHCRYRPELKTGPDACPFNYLYWNFFAINAARLENNRRVSMPIIAWNKKSAADQQAVLDSAEAFLSDV